MIGFDWGTSSLRAFLIGDDGRVLDGRQRPGGILSVAPGGDDAGLAFAETAETMVGAWLEAYGDLPLFACGMIGSDQGLAEAGYLDLPTDLAGLAEHLTTARLGERELHIVPGIRKDGSGYTAPDVIRGEETQLAGLAAADADVRQHVVLPGTHTKWAILDGCTVTDFITTMTGEVFGLLASSSILGRSIVPTTAFDVAAFDWGLSVGERDPAGMIASIFSARTWALEGRLAGNQVADYLSGILIGAEVAGHLQSHPIPVSSPLIVCGSPTLTERYSRALRRHGLSPAAADTSASASGLHRIAAQTELLRRKEHPSS
ncbi:2-dehydro-3-deoxygalactonokinase [Brevibacterium casei CIP 102111]|nr:2-dehydro-3-deoxygalactonokinase [Brevibacterium casei CIP 102111]VEW11480.1 2-keto-3-deoxy-galactonokinase [Brevibacterium casei]